MARLRRAAPAGAAKAYQLFRIGVVLRRGSISQYGHLAGSNRHRVRRRIADVRRVANGNPWGNDHAASQRPAARRRQLCGYSADHDHTAIERLCIEFRLLCSASSDLTRRYFSMPMEGRAGRQWVSRSEETVPCSSPTTWATRSGVSRLRGEQPKARRELSAGCGPRCHLLEAVAILDGGVCRERIGCNPRTGSHRANFGRLPKSANALKHMVSPG